MDSEKKLQNDAPLAGINLDKINLNTVVVISAGKPKDPPPSYSRMTKSISNEIQNKLGRDDYCVTATLLVNPASSVYKATCTTPDGEDEDGDGDDNNVICYGVWVDKTLVDLTSQAGLIICAVHKALEFYYPYNKSRIHCTSFSFPGLYIKPIVPNGIPAVLVPDGRHPFWPWNQWNTPADITAATNHGSSTNVGQWRRFDGELFLDSKL